MAPKAVVVAPVSLTPEEMDDIVAKLETCLAKVDVAQGGRVKLAKAEMELLKQIERARDFMDSVLRDRAALKTVFGAVEKKAADAEAKPDAGWGQKTPEEEALEEKARRRHSRVRAILESVKLSGQNADDKRLPNCLYVVDSIDKLLEETEGSSRAMVMQEKMRLSRSRSSLHASKFPEMGAMVKGLMAAKKCIKKMKEDPVPPIIKCTDLDELHKLEPSKKNALGTWMIWMVHRAHLNDPTLTKFDFTNCQMPCSYEQGRAQHVAPKLVKAIAANTHIEKLILCYTNLRGPEGRELGLSLQQNNTVRFLDIDSNMLGVEDVEVFMQNIVDNHNICELRLNNQIPGNAGQTRNGAMEALLTYSQKSPNLVKLGMQINEPHFANEISRSIMRNNDKAREARKTTAEQLAKEAEEEAAREQARLAEEEEEERRREEERLAHIADGGSIPSNSDSDEGSDEDGDEDGDEDSDDAEEGEDGEAGEAHVLSPTDPDVLAVVAAGATPQDGAGGGMDPLEEMRKSMRVLGARAVLAEAAAAEAPADSAPAAASFDPPPRVAAAEADEPAAPEQPCAEEPAEPTVKVPAEPPSEPPERPVEAPAEVEELPVEDLGPHGKVVWLLEHRPVLKAKIKQFHDENSQGGLLHLAELKTFCAEIESNFDVPASAFGDIEDDFERFDFDGSGALDFRESYKCVKACLVEFRKSVRMAPKASVPYMTPAEGGYTVVRVLASGGQGSASLVTDSSGAEVVLKTYSRENENAGGLQELMDEAEHMKMVNKHDHIAHCTAIFQDSENLYMISGANLGGDWRSVQKSASAQGVALTEDWYRTLFRQAFEGLLHLHHHAIMHCDIKEPNLMLKTEDFSLSQLNVVIIDLGLSHTFPAEQDICGTPGYIPPETWTTGNWYPRGDVFSMGVVILQLLLNKIPCEEEDSRGIFQEDCYSLSDVQEHTCKVDPPLDEATTEAGQASTELRELVGLCLAKDKLGRPRVPQALQHAWFAGQ